MKIRKLINNPSSGTIETDGSLNNNKIEWWVQINDILIFGHAEVVDLRM
jgi:hypothetical protein